ncbi:MAG: biopolymer transporter ExbD [Saprospiraceae bacterium]
MGIKKRARVSAQFSMSSLTDIIFLLLIFFMLTSAVVAPNALNLKLPGKSTAKVPPSSKRLDNVRISSTGDLYYNNRRSSKEDLEVTLRPRANSDFTMTISPDRGAPVEAVVTVMDIAMRFEINGVLAAED